MKKGKILTLLLATSLGAGALAMEVPKTKAYAETNTERVNKTETKGSDDDITKSGETESESITSDITFSENQPSFEGESSAPVNENSSIDTKATISENYYNFNIADAEKVKYGTSGKGRPLYYYKVGTGKKLLFMNFGLHGYEDAWAKDGVELTKLAKNLTERLAKQNSNGGLNDWSVIIVPSANPDGVLDGWTNNGPGRNQVSHKIDLNRSFPTYFKAQSNARNYTGSSPLLAPEAKSLANLVSSSAKQYSHMSLVDVHGWLNETIGDPSLGKAFNDNFGIPNKLFSTSAQGYLISYAHSQGALASLLELPMPSNSSSIEKNRYADKLYNSVNSIIKNGDGFNSMNADGEIYNTNSVNIRITTSTNSNIIGSYSKGTKIKILGRIGDWYKVKSNAGYGYVHRDYVKVLNDNNNNGNNNNGNDNGSNVVTQQGTIVNISTSLNVRASASTSAKVIGSLKGGSSVDIIAKEGNWYKIKGSFGIGYVSADYVKVSNTGGGNPEPENPTPPPTTNPSNETGKVINVTSKLNIRAGAGTNHAIVGSLPGNATVDILAKEGNWYKISYNGTVGYVSADYIQPSNTGGGNPEPENPTPPPTTNPSNETGKVINVTSKLNIRAGAGTNHAVVDSLPSNATVDILAKEGSWYKISYNGTVGYVSADYISVNGNNNNNNQGTKYGKVVDISTKLNIRQSPSTSSTVVGSLANNTKVVILEKTGSWYKISHNGVTGYVSASYLIEL